VGRIAIVAGLGRFFRFRPPGFRSRARAIRVGRLASLASMVSRPPLRAPATTEWPCATFSAFFEGRCVWPRKRAGRSDKFSGRSWCLVPVTAESPTGGERRSLCLLLPWTGR